jgi:hypothetical protein
MIRKIALFLCIAAMASVTALAADFNGKWTASIDTPVGVQNYTYEFHVDGAKLTGKATNDQGSSDLTEGKIDGDTITFVETMKMMDDGIRVEYTGKIDGDQINFTRKVGEFATDTFVAKRSK